MSYTVCDFETSTRILNKRKASPWHPENRIVASGWKSFGGQVEGRYHGSEGPRIPIYFDEFVPDSTRYLVGHNIKFDILWMIQNEHNLNWWMRFVANGGLVWDTQLAEYLLEGMAPAWQMNSLDDCVLKYGGNLKIDEVKAMWKAGIQTENIPEELLMRYLLGGPDEVGVEQHGDIGNTELVFLGQLKRAKKSGQIKSMMLNMGSLCATIEMERNGMFVDGELAETLRIERQAEFDKLTEELNALIPKNLPFEFKWSSRFHKSALIFGGVVNYDSREHKADDDGKLLYAQMEEEWYVLEDGSTISPRQWDEADAMGCDMPKLARYKGGKNAGEIKTKKVKVDDHSKPKMHTVKRQYEFPGYIAARREWMGSEEGVYSTAAEVIDQIVEEHSDVPFVRTLGDHTAVGKDLGTYYYREDAKGERKGMLTLVGEDGIIHHSLNHTKTVTGRLSSDSPNMQNIPKGKKSKIKTVFRSRFKGGSIIQSDFSALEIYVQANLTKCAQLIADLIAGLDMHCKRLSAKTGKPYEEVYKLCKGWTDEDGTEHPADPEWDYMRTGAKNFSFQRAYGAGVAAIVGATGMSVEDVEELIAAESAMFPEIDEYFDARTKMIEATAESRGEYVYHPLLRTEVPVRTGESVTPDGKRYCYTESPAPDFLLKKGIQVSFKPTEIKNYEVQGTGGEWAKAALWLMVREFYKRKNFDGLALLVNMVHDAAYADVDPSVRTKAAHVIHACMEAASDYMDIAFNWPIAVPVPSDTVWGDSMAEEEGVKLNQQVITALRNQLRADYMDGKLPSFMQ